MLTSIIKKEILEHILSYRFPLFTLICIVLIPLELYVNQLEFTKRVSDTDEQKRLSENALASSRMFDLFSGAIPLKGFHTPAPLSLFARGLEPSLPKYYEFKPEGFAPGESSLGEESILSAGGRIDFAFVVQMILSLIVLLFASDVVTSEKESGTLRGMLSNSVPRDSVILAKLIGGFCAMWIPFTLAFLAGLIVLSVTSFPFFSATSLTRILIVLLTSSWFMLAYFAIGVMISASTLRTRTSLVVILLVWITFQLIIPKVSDIAATLIHPIKTESVVSLQRSLISKSLEEEKAKALGSKYAELFGSSTRFTTDLPESPQTDEWNQYKKDLEQQYGDRKSKQLNDIDRAYEQEKATQQAIASSISLVSPSSAFGRFVADVCGTSESDRQAYLQAVRSHQTTLQNELFDHFKRTSIILPNGNNAVSMAIEKDVDLKSLPSFNVQPASLAAVFSNNLGNLISLAFWLVAPFAVAYVRFLRYDVR